MFGAPQMVEQAPHEVYFPPRTASTVVPIGTKVVSSSHLPGAAQQIGVDPKTAKPVFLAPVSARMTCDRVGTTSRQSGENPGPIPPVGIVSPQACAGVTTSCAAPKSWSGLAIFAVVIIGLWILAGASLRRFL